MSSTSRRRDRILLGGATPGVRAGNAVSTEVLLAALSRLGEVTLLTHRMSAVPSLERSNIETLERISIGTQPFCIHGEALLAGHVHRRQLSEWRCGWAVNSRYAGALYAAGIPYLIWEPTTTRDELRASTTRAVRNAGRGTGVGRMIHRASLPIGERVEGMLYRAAVAVLAMSEYTRELILRTHDVPEARVRVLAHPPSPPFVEALADMAPSNARSPDIDGAWRLLFVGRADDPRKNFQLLLDAFRLVRATQPKATLTVVGPHSEQWRRTLALDGLADAIVFAGPVSVKALATAYREHDLLLVPSRQEGFGIIVAEAFVAGIPVVATRCGGPEAMIRESGAGLLVQHSPMAMASAAIDILANPDRWRTMADLARRYGAEALSFERFAKQVGAFTLQAQSSRSAA